MRLLVFESTMFLFHLGAFRYNCIVGDIWGSKRSGVSSRSFWGKVVNVSFPIRDARGSIVKAPSTWLTRFEFISAISWSMRVGSSLVVNCKFLVVLMLFHFTYLFVGISIVLKMIFFWISSKVFDFSPHRYNLFCLLDIYYFFPGWKLYCCDHWQRSFGKVLLS